VAKGLSETVAEIRENIERDRLKAARKTLEKAEKSGLKGPPLVEVGVELLLAEGGGAAAAAALIEAQKSAESRVAALLKHAEAHLAKRPDDREVRDAVWEMALATGQYETSVRHLAALLKLGGLDGPRRGQALLERKDAVGATGIFLLASLGAVKTDRMKLADRLLQNDAGQRILGGVVEALRAVGAKEDAPIHYVLAQLAHVRGDKEGFLDRAAKAMQEHPEEVWTWTQGTMEADERLEIAVRNGLLPFVLRALADATSEAIAAAAARSQGDSSSVRLLRGAALLVKEKVSNGCRLLEEVVRREPAAAAPVADLLQKRAGAWPGVQEAFASVVAEGLAQDAARVEAAITGLLSVPESGRSEAWVRVAPRLLRAAPARDDLRDALGRAYLAAGEDAEAAALLLDRPHLALARAWSEDGKAGPYVVRAALSLAQKHEALADCAEWLLRAARVEASLLTEVGSKISGAGLSAATAIQSAVALLDRNNRELAADLLSKLPLHREPGEQVDRLLRERSLRDDRLFQVAAFRSALALGDAARARSLFKVVPTNMQVLAREAQGVADPARVLAELLIEQGKCEVAVGLVEARRAAGDPPRTLLPLADALLRSAPKLWSGRVVRARILQALKREEDAVRDLRAVPFDAAEIDEAFAILGELARGDARGAASLGRADIHIARKMYPQAVMELSVVEGMAQERLQRYDTIGRERGDLEAAHKGRALCLQETARLPEAAEAHIRRFSCSDGDPAAVATDLEAVARALVAANDIATATSVLERLPDHVSDGAERAIRVIGEDKRAALLILRSKMLLLLGRTEEAVEALDDLVRADPPSRAQAARALEAIIEAGRARPEADFSLARAYDAMNQAPRALAALQRLYQDDLTGRENVAKAAEQLVRRQDDPDVRLFLARVSLDLRDAAAATEHAVYARRLRPGSRRDCVELLRRALDLDAFAADTHFALAEAHLAGDEADDAVRHFRAAVETDRERAAGAIRAMEEAAPRSQNPALLWLAVGTTQAEFARNHAAAVAAFTGGLNANPRAELRVPLLLGRGDSYAALGKDNEAFDDFDEASRHDLLERRYYEFLRSRHRRRILEAAEQAKARSGESFTAAAEACGRYLRLGRNDDAVEVAQKALAANPNDVAARYLVGVALHAANRFDAAARALEMVRAAATADSEIGRAARMLLAGSYLDKGDRDSARACLTEIEAVDSSYPGLRARRAALAPPADDPHAPLPLFVRPEFPRPTE